MSGYLQLDPTKPGYNPLGSGTGKFQGDPTKAGYHPWAEADNSVIEEAKQRQDPEGYAKRKNYTPEQTRLYNESRARGAGSGTAIFDSKGKVDQIDEGIDAMNPKVKGLPATPDATDKLLQKARASMAMRLKMGKNQSNSFGTKPMGTVDLSKPMLGGY